MSCRKRTKTGVSGQDDTTRMDFGEGKCESIVNGQLRRAAYNLLRPKDALAWKIDHLQAAANERLLLRACEFEKLVFEQGIRDENLVGQPQEGIEQ
jgi:hypothetical protein